MKTNEEMVSYYADDYVFRGSIVGPITGRDVAETQKGFNLLGAYPDIDRAPAPPMNPNLGPSALPVTT